MGQLSKTVMIKKEIIKKKNMYIVHMSKICIYIYRCKMYICLGTHFLQNNQTPHVICKTSSLGAPTSGQESHVGHRCVTTSHSGGCLGNKGQSQPTKPSSFNH